MLKNSNEFLGHVKQPAYIPHPTFSHLNTFTNLSKWNGNYSVEFPKMRLVLHSVDYMESPIEQPIVSTTIPQLHFQQNTYRIWYQIDGAGILQNVTRKIFGTARPGLLGLMDQGERHTYLHQRGHFSCFQILFSLFPSSKAKCYWNSGIEGKTILDDAERSSMENSIFNLLHLLSNKEDLLGIETFSSVLDIFTVLFKKGLILIEECRFPKNKAKSLVIKAKNFMNSNYTKLHHQNDLEKVCGVDINYLNILFKKETSQTLYHYLTGVRMEHAKFLLETTTHSIADIADETGYPNANSFSRAFKRRERLTPQNFRENNN